jgi:hypothetical protein
MTATLEPQNENYPPSQHELAENCASVRSGGGRWCRIPRKNLMQIVGILVCLCGADGFLLAGFCCTLASRCFLETRWAFSQVFLFSEEYLKPAQSLCGG